MPRLVASVKHFLGRSSECSTARRRRPSGTRPRDLLYRHTITFDGTLVSIPMAMVPREQGMRLARLLDKSDDRKAVK